MGWLLLSEVSWKGIKGAPATPSKSWISAVRPPKTADMDAADEDLESAAGFIIHDFMLFQALAVVVVSVLAVKLSSGMGTSSTVSSASSR